MNRRLSLVAATALLLTSLLSVAPVGAQGRSAGCTQDAVGGGEAVGNLVSPTNPRDSRQTVVGVVAAAVQNVSVIDDIEANLNALNGANVQLVCLNDALNQNDVRILQDILNESPILNHSLNNTLRDSVFLNNLLQDSNIALLNNVQVVAVNLGTGQVFLLNDG
jgi:hypothetical protein